MNNSLFPHSSAQRGVLLPLVAIGLTGLLAVSGLALDMGHVYINKSRLQDAVDAAALSAAKTLDETGNTAAALAAADAAFTHNTQAPENRELASIPSNALDVSFSRTPNPFTPTNTQPLFVRVSLNTWTMPTHLLGVLGLGTQTLSASAVAGPSPLLTEVCDPLPLVACTGTGGSYYGYTIGQEVSLKTGSDTKGWDIGPGNYRTIQLNCGSGGDCLKDNLAGAYEACLNRNVPAQTKAGNSVGPIAQGLNTRFGCPPPGCGSIDTNLYPPDKVTDAAGKGYPDTYQNYQIDYRNQDWDVPSGRSERRLVTIVMGDCSGTVNGNGTVNIKGFGCFF